MTTAPVEVTAKIYLRNQMSKVLMPTQPVSVRILHRLVALRHQARHLAMPVQESLELAVADHHALRLAERSLAGVLPTEQQTLEDLGRFNEELTS